MVQVDIHEAKIHLSRLLDRMIGGEEIVIARAGQPIARLIACEPPKEPRIPGQDAEKVQIAEDFDAPLDGEILWASGKAHWVGQKDV